MGDQQKKTAMKFKMMQFGDVKHTGESTNSSVFCLWLWLWVSRSCVCECPVCTYAYVYRNECVNVYFDEW